MERRKFVLGSGLAALGIAAGCGKRLRERLAPYEGEISYLGNSRWIKYIPGDDERAYVMEIYDSEGGKLLERMTKKIGWEHIGLHKEDVLEIFEPEYCFYSRGFVEENGREWDMKQDDEDGKAQAFTRASRAMRDESRTYEFLIREIARAQGYDPDYVTWW